MNAQASSNGRLFTFQETMAALHVSRSTLYRLIERGDILGYKVGSTWRFWERDVLRVPQQWLIFKPETEVQP